MGKKKKIVLGVVGGVVVLLVIALVVVWLSLDGIIRSKVESSTAAATGQTTTLNGASLGLFSGTLGLNGLAIDNPAGFTSGKFLQLNDAHVQVQVGSLLSDTVQVPDITLDGLHITLAQDGLKNNLEEIMQQIQKVREQTAGGSAPATSSKQLDIGRIRLTNTTITLRMQNVPGVKGGDLDVPIKELTLEHPTNPDGRAMRIADVLGQVLLATTQAALQDQRVPEQVRTALQGVTALGKDLPNLLQGLQKGKVNQQDVNNLIQGIGGLIDQNKKKQPATAPGQ